MISMLSRRSLTNVREGPGFELVLLFCLRRSRHDCFCSAVFVVAVWFGFRWHPRCVFGLLVLPLCGAALTFFAAAKKVSKESGPTPPARVIVHGLSTSPSFMRQRSRACSLPTLRMNAPPTAHTRTPAIRVRPSRPLCGKRCVGFRTAEETFVARSVMGLPNSPCANG